jgi:hypothetical protein
MMLIRGTKNNRVGYWKVGRRHLGLHGFQVRNEPSGVGMITVYLRRQLLSVSQ